ncbi:MAG: hypothetical protein PVI27_00810 [Desulfobacteraceae bacterium]
MKRRNQMLLLGGIALVHWAATRAVGALILHQTANHVFEPQLPLVTRLLVAAAKVLYFPVVSLSLFPRAWFPGGWIALPILINSLVWALGLWVVARLLRRLYHRRSG